MHWNDLTTGPRRDLRGSHDTDSSRYHSPIFSEARVIVKVLDNSVLSKASHRMTSSGRTAFLGILERDVVNKQCKIV